MDLSLTGPVLMVSVKHDKLLSAAGKQVGCLGTDASTMPTLALTLKMGRVRAAHFVGVQGFVGLIMALASSS